MRRNRRAWLTAAVAIMVLSIGISGKSASFAATATKAADNSPVVRVNQVGYVTAASKSAFAMLPGRVHSVAFTVTNGNQIVYRGISTADLGSWNTNYRAVYRLDFSALRADGTYRVHAAGAVSPAFQIGSSAALFTGLVNNGVSYFTSERDGADVNPSVLGRQPANLTDENASVYAAPVYDSSDNLIGGFTRVPGGPVDVSGGWFDAGGGYEKFAYTVTYADALMLIAQREFPGESRTLGPEANFGLQWLAKLWNPAKKLMFIQVGIGNGNAASKNYPSGKIQGDYNFWFLPQAEDRMDVRPGHNPGPTAYFVKYRPVFPAAPAGQKVSPDLAGRFAADFALGAQIAQGTGQAGFAQQLLSRARSVYADARTSGVGQIVTTYPYDYYPGSQWKSDMLWGAAEIALADEAAGASPDTVTADLANAAFWAKRYLAQPHADTFNLYDTGAVAEAELLRAMKNAGSAVIAPSSLLSDMAAQLRWGEAQAKSDPFHPAITVGNGDLTPHAFGTYITDALYREYGGSDQFRSFAGQQLDYALGANPWGVSFVVGAGTSFPHCMQSEIANLAGSLTGSASGGRGIQVGATTDGPSATANFSGLGSVPTMRACGYGSYAAFNTKNASYLDNVVSWPSVEPADDYSANSLFAFALGAAGLG
ncbi:MAG TPA: glycoside hydrolase family 9 protein [Streptosporangiaceae bacterium]|nr:glycoside hydrolase family 9 protein [Streptosporangiaceae bacterium]